MRYKTAAKPALLMLGALAASLFAAGCGNFWMPPSGTSSTSTGTTASSITLTSPTTATVGSAISLTATVTPTAATGTVTFYSDSASIGTGTLSDGTATLSSYEFASAGTYSLTATYGGSTTYASSDSNTVSVVVSAASNAILQTANAPGEIHTTAYGSSPIHAAQAFTASGATYTARDGEAVVVDAGGSAALNGTRLVSAAGAGRGVLLEGSKANSDATARFTMTGGSLAYSCGATDGCADAAGRKQQASAFAVTDAKAAIALTDVTVDNATATDAHREGTLLTVASAKNGGSGAAVALTVKGTSLTGDVVADGSSTAAVALLSDDAGTGSSLTGAIHAANHAGSISLTLDAASSWTVTGSSYLGSLSGVDVENGAVSNIDGGGHCVFYSGTVDGMSGATLALSDGGVLAPAGTTGLACH
jgi:hypothetical protein